MAELVLSDLALLKPAGASSSRFHYRLSRQIGEGDSEESSGSGSDPEEGGGGSNGATAPAARCASRVPRRPRLRHLVIRHSLATPLPACGEQVWRGALALGDAALAPEHGAARWRALDLGAGAGFLAALAAARLRCPLFIATDAAASALQLAAENIAAAEAARGSAGGSNSNNSSSGGRTLVRHLSWFPFIGVDPDQLTADELLQLLNGRQVGGGTEQQPQLQQQAPAQQPAAQQRGEAAAQRGLPHCSEPAASCDAAAGFPWSPEDVQLLLTVDTLLAADVLYDPPLTEAFVYAAAVLMRWIARCRSSPIAAGAPAAAATAAAAGAAGSVAAASGAAGLAESGGGAAEESPAAVRLLLAAEKRYNFTLRDSDAPRAAAWEHFMTYVAVEGDASGSCVEAAGGGSGGGGGSSSGEGSGHRKLLRGRRLALPPQLFEYDSSPDMEFWELTAM